MISTRDGFERHVLPLQDGLFHAALALTSREADALDLVQETLLRAWKRASTFDRGTHLKAWLYTILRNAHVDRRRGERLTLEENPEDRPQPARDAAPGPLETVLPDGLRAALRTLSPAHQILLHLCDLEGLSYAQIADVLGCPMGSVMSGLHNARTRLRKALSDPSRAENKEAPRRG